MERRGAHAGEFEIIARYFAPLAAKAPLAFGLTDDAAVYRAAAGYDLVLKTDMIVGGVHFLPNDPPRSIAQKLLRVNLSDLASKGAKPKVYLLNCSLPQSIDEDWIKSFAEGLAADQGEFGLVLVGGDTTATSGPVTLSATVIGEVPRGSMIRRKGARSGDGIWVSGNIGDAAIGLRLLKGEDLGVGKSLSEPCIERYRAPKPRLALGQKLRGLAYACLDISDGLVADLGHMCEVSNVGAEVIADGVPISAAAHRAIAAGRLKIGDLLTAGDDYELIFAIAAKDEMKLSRVAKTVGIKVTKIGRITRKRELIVRDGHGEPLLFDRAGYQHF
jgi:thiamine-monophosphate kinase